MHHPGTGSAGLLLLVATALLCACANRGMHAPSDDGAGGTGISPTGSGGTDGSGVAGPCAVPPPHDAGGPCTANLGFDTDLQGATIPAGDGAAFTAVTVSDTQTYCGAGALAITASFSGTNGPTTKGAVELPVDDADSDFSGKTLTVHVSALPGCSTDLGFAVVLRTTAGPQTVIPTVRPIGAGWQELTATLRNDAGAGASVLAISLQAFSSTGYAGTIYVDDIDVR